MSLKDKRPDTCRTVESHSSNQGALMSCESNYNLAFHKSQYSGNKCGHLTMHPQSAILPFHHKKRPDLLEKLKARLETFYFTPKKYLKNLFFVNKDRQKRSERREAIKAVCEVFLHYTQLENLTIGKRLPSGEIKPLSLIQIAKLACLEIRRTKRAIADLIKAGYLKTKRHFSKGEGGFIGHLSTRHFTAKFFIDLGISYASLNLRQWWKIKRDANEKAKRTGFAKKLAVRFDVLPKTKPAVAPVKNTVAIKKRSSPEEEKAKAGRMVELLRSGLTFEEAKARVYGS